MTQDQFKAFCDDAKKRGAIDFTRRSHYEQMPPLFEAHAEEIIVSKKDFHSLPGNVYYPHKETADRLGKAAGISFARNPSVLKQPDGAWVATAFPQELGPDGQMISWACASYEFNPSDRAEEELLRAAIKAHSDGPTDAQLKLKTLEYKKVALRRADTGSRIAAIISTIGMPTGFRDLFSANDSPDAERGFLFSRIIYNAKNKMVMDRALDSMFAATKLLGGNASGEQAIEDMTETGVQPESEPEFRNVTEKEQTVSDIANEAGGFSDDPAVSGVDDAFDGIPPEVSSDMTPRGRVKYLRVKYDKDLPVNGKALMDADLADQKKPAERFRWLYEQAAIQLSKKGITVPALVP